MIRTITTWQQDYAPPKERWAACYGEYDGGDNDGNGPHCGTGPDEAAAIIDLLENYELPKG